MFEQLHSTPKQEIYLELIETIRKASTFAPRSQQVAIGASEIGVECIRRLSYKMLNWPKVNDSSEVWPAAVGTAIHAHLADIFAKDENYEVEQRVQIRGGIYGTVDLYDKRRGIVLDWKTTGTSGLEKRKRSGGTNQHITQVQLYGYGKENQGAPVSFVGLVYLPTSGSLADMVVDLHPYSREEAEKSLARIDDIQTMLSMIDVENNPQMWEQIPSSSDRLCMYCPYFKPYSEDLAAGCPGDTKFGNPKK